MVSQRDLDEAEADVKASEELVRKRISELRGLTV